MRYDPSQRLLRLALMLAGTRLGLTLDEMAEEVGVGRRTAERLRDALTGIFPRMTFEDDESRVRRWRLPASALAGVADVRAEAVAAVEGAARVSDSTGDVDRAGLLREAATALRALMRPVALRRAEPDIAALMEAEGTAMRPGPRPKIAPGILPTLRRAILGMQLVVVRYRAKGAEGVVARVLCPYGILHGGRGWLVAHVENLPEMRLWRLDRIETADLVDRGFKRENFDLHEYAAQSFGVFQEEPMNVVLRFDPEAADDALGWNFHASQTMVQEADGSVIVRFRAAGMRELCWHLFTWGTAMTVVTPTELRLQLGELASMAGAHHLRERR